MSIRAPKARAEILVSPHLLDRCYAPVVCNHGLVLSIRMDRRLKWKNTIHPFIREYEWYRYRTTRQKIASDTSIPKLYFYCCTASHCCQPSWKITLAWSCQLSNHNISSRHYSVQISPMLSLWEKKHFSTLAPREGRIFGLIATWPWRGQGLMC